MHINIYKIVLACCIIIQSGIEEHSLWAGNVPSRTWAAITGHNKDLIYAAQEGNLTGVQKLLSLSTININAQDHEGNTALILATFNGYQAIVKVLVEAGANVNQADSCGVTPLMWALTDKRYPEIVRLLLQAHAQVNLQDNHGNTALTRATETHLCGIPPALSEDTENQQEIIQLLIDAQADVNTRNEWCLTTPLMWAVEHGHQKRVQEFLVLNADVNAQDRSGNTALMYAARHDRQEIVHILLTSKACPKMVNHEGKTALEIAQDANHSAIEKLLAHRDSSPC